MAPVKLLDSEASSCRRASSYSSLVSKHEQPHIANSLVFGKVSAAFLSVSPAGQRGGVKPGRGLSHGHVLHAFTAFKKLKEGPRFLHLLFSV